MKTLKEVKLAEYIKGRLRMVATRYRFLVRLFLQINTNSRVELIGLIFGRKLASIRLNEETKITISRKEIFSELWYLMDITRIRTRLQGMKDSVGLHLVSCGNLKCLTFKYNGTDLNFQYFDNNDLLTSLMAINITYVETKWEIVNASNAIIFDVGANIGDSAVYFVLRGAKRVIAIEPFDSLFRLLIKNVKLQEMGGVITCVNKSLEELVNGVERTKTTSPNYPFIGSRFVVSSDLDTNKIIDHNRFSGLLTEAEGDANDLILKISCAGCEEILLNVDKKLFRKFKQICIEYNYGYKSLVNKLVSSGFSVSYSRPHGSYARSLDNPHVFLGIIVAKRV